MELYRTIKKQKYGVNNYIMKMGRGEWGLRKHSVNQQYIMLCP